MDRVILFACVFSWIFVNCAVAIPSQGASGNTGKQKPEFDFEDLDVESITPNVDVNYERDSETTVDDLSCECGTSKSPWVDLADIDVSIRSGNHSVIKKSKKSLPLPEISPLIIGGNIVRRGEIPWMVAITKYQHKKTPRWRVICGGVLLNNRFVATAAHCIKDRFKDTLEVVFNVQDATVINSDREVIRRKIERFITHPAFNSTTIDSDIALIEMKMPLNLETMQAKIRPICLPKRKEYAHRMGTASGWGYTSYGDNNNKGDNSPNLRKVSLPILSRQECLKTKIPTKTKITENMFCAGFREGVKDACINDSGGPLTVLEGRKSYLVGLISFGIGCSLEDYPGVYVRVKNFVPWIKENAKTGLWCRE